MSANEGRSIRALRIGYDLKDPPTYARALDEVKQALTVSDGALAEAAKRLGVSWRQLMRWIEQHAPLKAHLDELRRKVGGTRDEATATAGKSLRLAARSKVKR